MDGDAGLLETGARGRESTWVDAAAVFLLGAGGAWSAGNIGPVAADLEREFGIGLASVGLLSGTIFLAAMIAGLLAAPRAAEALGLTRALALAAALGGAGNLLFAAANGFALAAAGRVGAGVGLGFVAGLAPVLARITGGVRRVGLFGASFQLGIGLGLGVGSALADADVSWRVGFLVTAAVALSAIPLVLREHIPAERHDPVRGFFALALRSPPIWRLALLFMALFGVPVTLGAWFVHYATVDGSVRPALAGALAFVLFATSGLMRQVGGSFAARGVPQPLLTGAAPALATIGLAAIGVDLSPGVIAAAVLLMGAGFALPYATMMIEAQRLFPREPSRPTSLMTIAGTAIGIPVIPAVGSLLDSGDGDVAFVVLGAFVLLAALFNVRPAVLSGG